MSSKHFVDDPTHLVQTSLSALTLINPSVAFDAENRIVYRRPTKELTENPKVSIITGGGSGHEPVSPSEVLNMAPYPPETSPA